MAMMALMPPADSSHQHDCCDEEPAPTTDCESLCVRGEVLSTTPATLDLDMVPAETAEAAVAAAPTLAAVRFDTSGEQTAPAHGPPVYVLHVSLLI